MFKGVTVIKTILTSSNLSVQQELNNTKAYNETSEEEKSFVLDRCNHLALKFSVNVKEQ